VNDRHRAHRKKPKFLTEEPELYPELFPVWEAFNSLHSSRDSNGMAVSALRPADVIAFLNLRLFGDQEAVSEWYDFIAALDSEWLFWAREKVDAKESEKGKRNANNLHGTGRKRISKRRKTG